MSQGLLRLAGVTILAASAIATEPLLLENAYVRVTVDPLQGGAVTSMISKQAIMFPFIADKGVGFAGSGTLFTPAIEVNGKTAGELTMRVSKQSARAITLSAPLGVGLSFERHLQVGERQSGLSVEDVIRNDSANPIAVRFGSTSRQQSEPWRLTDRSWIGGQDSSIERHTPAKDVAPARLQISSGPFFWRQIEEYGTGFLYRVHGFEGPVELSAEVLKEKGNPIQVIWKSGELTIPAHGKLAANSAVSIDNGGGAPDQHNAFAEVLVRSDAALAGRSGQPLTAFATVVSPEPRKVRISISTDHELTHADVALAPGKLARVPVLITPSSKGDLPIRVTVTENGKEIGTATGHSIIDGDPANETWKTYISKMPEEHYQGTWAEIGQQLANNSNHIGAPTSIQVKTQKGAANDLSFYSARFPFYTELLSGVAKAEGVAADKVALIDRASHDRAACMDIAFYGPDGPINAFSKERSGSSFKGLGYVKVVPATGYPFHIYMSVGINSEGLSTSSATLNEDERTHAVDFKALEDWKKSGKHVMPPGVAMWMLLSMSRNVDEALAMIQNPEAPMEFTGNMLLLDRAGDAARVESVGIDHQVFRSDARNKGFFVAGNYPHERADGMFQIGPRFGWAANTMQRERFLQDFVGSKQGNLSLQDVVTLMQTHESGGMCQHIYDNPGALYTSSSFIAVTKTSELWLSQGPPCQADYVRHSLR